MSACLSSLVSQWQAQRRHRGSPALLTLGAVCRYDLLVDLQAVSEEEPLPDMELLVTSTDYKVVRERSPDGSVLPIFKSTGSKFAYDLVWPSCLTS